MKKQNNHTSTPQAGGPLASAEPVIEPTITLPAGVTHDEVALLLNAILPALPILRKQGLGRLVIAVLDGRFEIERIERFVVEPEELTTRLANQFKHKAKGISYAN